MKLFTSYLRLIRPVNLFMIAFTLYMVRFAFILPLLNFSNFPLQVKETVFALFALAFIFIAAGGYIINDYYDMTIDKVNKPDKVIIGNTISPKTALRSYYIFTLFGLACGFWSCYKAGAPLLELLFVFYAIALWFYSYKLKSTFLLGNTLIAIFLGLVPLASAYIEVQADLNNPESPDTILDASRMGAWSIALFAFIITLIREIVKDVEDTEGDQLANCRTLPIVWGIKKSKITVLSLLILMMVLLAAFQYYAWGMGWHPTVYFLLLLVQLPCLIILWKIRKASTPKEFHGISNWLKIVMITGICYLFVFAYESYITLQIIRKFMHNL